MSFQTVGPENLDERRLEHLECLASIYNLAVKIFLETDILFPDGLPGMFPQAVGSYRLRACEIRDALRCVIGAARFRVGRSSSGVVTPDEGNMGVTTWTLPLRSGPTRD